jgi:hypothetical protein
MDEAAPGDDEPECETQVELRTPEVNGGTRLDEPCYRASETLSVPEGTEEEPVFLVGEGDELGAWRGVRLVRTKSTVNQLDHTRVRRGGGSDWRVASSRRPVCTSRATWCRLRSRISGCAGVSGPAF